MGLDRDGGRYTLHRQLMADGATTGWQRTHSVHPLAVTIEGPSGGFTGVTIYVSNRLEKPTAADANHPTLIANQTTPKPVSSDGPYRWMKAAGGGAGVYVDVAGANDVAAK